MQTMIDYGVSVNHTSMNNFCCQIDVITVLDYVAATNDSEGLYCSVSNHVGASENKHQEHAPTIM